MWLYVLYSSETFGFEWMSSLSLQQLKVEENVDRQTTKHHRGSVVKRTCSYRGPGPPMERESDLQQELSGEAP